jgi:exodeoxyribonuclease V alpha subunit
MNSAELQTRVTEIAQEHGTESDRALLKSILEPLEEWVKLVYLNYPYGFSWNFTHEIGKEFGRQHQIEGHILYFLNNKIAADGHTCYPLSLLFGALKYNFPHIIREKSDVEPALRRLIDLGKVVVKNKAVWIQHSYSDESKILNGLREIVSRPSDIEAPVEAFTAGLTDMQASAIRSLNKSRVLILDGYPGTGKTHLSSKIAEILEADGFQVTLLAPTGLAAKNLKDRCKKYASTIHSFVLSQKNRESGLHGRQAFLIDEFSMVDTRIFADFFEVIQDCEAFLVLVGDTNQLPSVGGGNLLSEIISLKDHLNFSYVQLTEIIRQKTGSQIAQNAALIRRGNTNLISESEFKFYEMPEPEIPDLILKSAQKLMNENRNFVILSPMKRGSCGVDALNIVLKEIFNPPAIEKREINSWREGDRILVNRNFYDVGLVNGDIGFIKEIHSQTSMTISIAGKEYKVEKDVIYNLKLAYAITCHKSQGLEFDNVIMPFVDSFGIMLKNRLLYTAITRAKQKCIIFGSSSALTKAIRNNRDQDRFTGLRLLETGKPSWSKS